MSQVRPYLRILINHPTDADPDETVDTTALSIALAALAATVATYGRSAVRAAAAGADVAAVAS